MEWRDEGVVLTVRRHGEGGAIVELLTAAHGRRLGLVQGGGSRRRAAELQPGAQVSATWRARLETGLGAMRLEAADARAGRLLDDPPALAALASVTALLSVSLPEAEPQPDIYPATLELLDALVAPARWPGLYAAWELRLLSTLGFGLDLERCAATGSTQELIYVSPRTGRAVSRGAGAPYADRLLPLPTFLRLGEPARLAELSEALRLTGHFLDTRVAPALGRPTPPARARLATLVAAHASREVG